jgi:hypothetical protein
MFRRQLVLVDGSVAASNDSALLIEMGAVHDPQDDGREPVVVLGRLASDGAHGRHVVVLHHAPEGVHQKMLREVPQIQCVRPEQVAAKAVGSVHLGAVEERSRGLDIESAVLEAPRADRVEVLQRVTEWVHDGVARGAGGIRAVLLEALPH